MDHPFIPMHRGHARATLSRMSPACYNARPCQFKNYEKRRYEPLIQSPQAFGEMITEETEKWKRGVEFAGLKVE
jgi:hypothetical protein